MFNSSHCWRTHHLGCDISTISFRTNILCLEPRLALKNRYPPAMSQSECSKHRAAFYPSHEALSPKKKRRMWSHLKPVFSSTIFERDAPQNHSRFAGSVELPFRASKATLALNSILNFLFCFPISFDLHFCYYFTTHFISPLLVQI